MREIVKGKAENTIDILETKTSKKRYSIKQIEDRLAYFDASIDRFKEARDNWQLLYEEAKKITAK